MIHLRKIGLFLGTVGILLGPTGSAAQGNEACLRPLQDPSRWSGGPLRSEAVQAQRPLYPSPDGRLCQRFSPRMATPRDDQSIQEQALTPGKAFLLSAVLPGTGQRMLGQDRWVAYLAAEAWAWAQYLARRREGHNLQDRYRDLAWLVARRVSSGPRVDGGFEYYEALTQFQASGAYDIDPDGLGIQPEENPETFNGSIWELAREIFFLDEPGTPIDVESEQYKRALQYYLSRAYSPVFAWNWSSSTLQQEEFARLIRSSDENLRRGTTMVGVIIANHLVSAVDALVSGRLLQERALDPIIEVGLVPTPFQRDAIAFSVRIPTG